MPVWYQHRDIMPPLHWSRLASTKLHLNQCRPRVCIHQYLPKATKYTEDKKKVKIIIIIIKNLLVILRIKCRIKAQTSIHFLFFFFFLVFLFYFFLVDGVNEQLNSSYLLSNHHRTSVTQSVILSFSHCYHFAGETLCS